MPSIFDPPTPEFFERMMRAAAEGQQRARVNTAAGTIGASFQSDPDNTKYCANAVEAIVCAVMRRAGCDMESATMAIPR